MRKRLQDIPVESLIFLLALLFRFWGLGNGLPDALHPDETMLIRRALRFGSGDLNPHFFYYPSLSMYLYFLLDGVYFALGRFGGFFHGPSDLARTFVSDPTHFYLIARSAIALADALSVIAIIRLGSKYISKEAGLLAGLMWALFPQAIAECKVAKPDSLMVLLALAALVILSNTQRRNDVMAAGLVLGLSASAKYQAVIVGPIACIWIATQSLSVVDFMRRAAFFTFFCIIGFVLGTPYSLIDFGNFMSNFRSQSEVMQAGLYGAEGGARGWTLYLKEIAAPGGSLLLGLMALLGAVVGFRERPKQTALFVGVPVLLFLGLGGQRIFGAHYFYLGYPFLFLLSASAFIALGNWLETRLPQGPMLAYFLFLVALAPFAMGAARNVRQLSQTDTRVECRQWIEANVPAGSVVLADASAPQLKMTRAQLDDLYTRAKEAGHIKADYFALLRDASVGGGYKVFLTEQPVMQSPKSLVQYSRQVQDLIPLDKGIPWVKAQGVQYVVVSDNEVGLYVNGLYSEKYPEAAAFYSGLETKAKRLAEFPSGPTRPGPGLRVYQL